MIAYEANYKGYTVNELKSYIIYARSTGQCDEVSASSMLKAGVMRFSINEAFDDLNPNREEDDLEYDPYGD
jgi:hypothetical protein